MNQFKTGFTTNFLFHKDALRSITTRKILMTKPRGGNLQALSNGSDVYVKIGAYFK
jgi:hypothetical protein